MDIDSKVNMSLDDIVKQKQNNKKRNNRRSNIQTRGRSIKSRLNTAPISKKSIPVCIIYNII